MNQRVLPPIDQDLVPLLAAVIEATLVHKRAQNLREPTAARSHQLGRLEKLNAWARGAVMSGLSVALSTSDGRRVMAKGRIVNTTPKGKHSLERTRYWVIKEMLPSGRNKDPGMLKGFPKGYTIARGAGSINCESDIRQLIASGRTEDAVAMYDRHHSIRGVPPITKLAMWRRQIALGVAA